MDVTPKRMAAVERNTSLVTAAKLPFTARELVSWANGMSTRMYARLVYLDGTQTKKISLLHERLRNCGDLNPLLFLFN